MNNKEKLFQELNNKMEKDLGITDKLKNKIETEELIKDIYHNIHELLEQSHMVHGDNNECGSRVLGIRQEYNKVLDRIEEYWGLEQF